MKKYSVGILGATGFTGLELLKLLKNHPSIEVAFVTSERHEGKTLSEFFPFLFGPMAQMKFINLETALKTPVEGIFSCLPHKTAVEKLSPFYRNTKSFIVDLSADFRLDSAKIYEEYYCPHSEPELLQESLYGLCEWQGVEKTRKYRLVGNPGCYPTSILLPLLPLVKEGLVEVEGLIADSKSGVSGAGKEPTPATHYVEVNESFSAYKVGDEHRHLSELNEQLSLASGQEVDLIFTPHLVPMSQGILSTIYARLKLGISEDDVRKCLLSQYKDSALVELLDGGFPKTSWVRQTNRCVFGVKVLEKSRTLIIVSAIDNLIKGASGQALQNMNILLGLDETEGLL